MTTPHPCHIAYYLLNGVLSDRYLNPNCSHYADVEWPIAIDDIARAYYLLNDPKLQTFKRLWPTRTSLAHAVI